MARLILFLLVPLVSLAACRAAEVQADAARRAAGECARCHVISVVEWSCSGHVRGGTDCVACHGKSQGHVIDERNNIKPDKMPRGASIAGLCLDCHEKACPKTKQSESCQTCHHVHALVDPQKPPSIRDEQLEQLEACWKRYSQLMQEGEHLVKIGQWEKACKAFQSALGEKPRDEVARAGVELCQRQLKPGLPGFEIMGTAFEQATGLPCRVRVAEMKIPMILVAGGEFDLGADQVTNAQPAHRVRVGPFYMAQHELTQSEWQAVMGTQPSAHKGETNFPFAAWMPVEQVSWEDAVAFTRKLNERVSGGGFRLPTEAEWEFVARAGGESGEAFDRTAPRVVEQGTTNRLGFFDLAGNVHEWCSSGMVPYPYNPADGREAMDHSSLRVLRGGAFCEPLEWYHPALRHGERPTRRLKFNGIRLARSIPPVSVTKPSL